MKTIALTFLSCLISFTAFAQQPAKKQWKPPAERAQEISAELNLTTEQAAKVVEALEAEHAAQTAARTIEDKSERLAVIKANTNTLTKTLSEILTPEQMLAYKNILKREQAERKAAAEAAKKAKEAETQTPAN